MMIILLLVYFLSGGVRFIKKSRGSGAQHEKHIKSAVNLIKASVKCLGELIKNAPHFNYRKNIISVLIPNIELTTTKDLFEVRFYFIFIVVYLFPTTELSLLSTA